MSYELTGEVIQKFDIETFASGFQKQNIVVKTPDQYPQEIQIEFTQNKIDLIEKIKEGDHVTVSFNLNGRSWTSPTGEVKYFNSITGWKVTKASGAAPTPEPIQASAPAPASDPKPAPATPEIFEEEEDDLPF